MENHYSIGIAGHVDHGKTTLVDGDRVEPAELEVREMLSGTYLDHCPFFGFSAKYPELSSDIVRRIDTALNNLPAKKSAPPSGYGSTK